jgi:hypothetical protein
MGFPSAGNLISDPSSIRQSMGLVASKIGDVIVDVVRSYSPPRESEITDRPVEAGFDITDARIIKPQSITMDIILTDPDFSGANLAKAALSGTFTQQLTMGWRDKRDRLYEIFNTNELIEIATTEAVYSSMMLIDIRPERRAATANAFFCTIEAREVKIVSSEMAIVDATSVPKKVQKKETDDHKTAGKRKKPPSNKGKKKGETATTKKSSILNSMIFGS